MSRWRVYTSTGEPVITNLDQGGYIGDLSTWLGDTIADLPTTAEGATNGDWGFTADGGMYYRTSGAWVQASGGSGAPTDVDYLVGTASAGLSAEIVVGTTPGGELGGTWASPTVDATHSGSAHMSLAKSGSSALTGAVTLSQGANVTLTQVGQDIAIAASGSGGAPTDADYLVGTANAGLSAEIVVGTSPGGELGGTWASPTVDATHSGSAHHTQSHDHSAAGDGTTLTPATLNIPNAAAPAPTAEGQAAWDNDDNFLRIGDGAASKDFFPTVDATSDPLAVSTAAADGTEKTTARKDHVHAHEAAHINHDTTWAAAGDVIVGTANDTAAVVSIGSTGQVATVASGTLAWQNPGNHVTFSKEGNLATGTGSIRWYNDLGRAITIFAVRASVGTAPTTQSIILDVNESGTTLYTTQANRPTIAAAGNTTDATLPDDTSVADNAYITVDIDQVGSGTVGADLSVTIWYR